MEPEKDKKEETHEKKEHSKKITNKIRENPWIVSTFILGIFVLLLVIANFSGMTGKAITAREAGEKLLNFYEEMGAEGLEINSVREVSGLYQVIFEYEGGLVPVYVTKDGKLAGSLNALPTSDSGSTSGSETQTDIPKSDKPKVELFVMTHCPYGTQAEKGFIPATETLGGTIDSKIRFVHYFMHDPEETETPRQVCIREEQSGKYYDYLECFLEDGDSERCITKVGIDKTKMNECINKGNADKYYSSDSALSEGYGVSGSPTLVINGKIVSSSRSPGGFLDTICQAFNNAPEVCGAELSTTSPSPGFGYGEGSSTSATC